MAQSRYTHFTYSTPHGAITIRADESGVTNLVLGRRSFSGTHAASPLTNEAATQVQEFLAGKRKEFDIPLHLEGTAFQRAVWEAVQSIPYGSGRTASELAVQLGKPDSQRSVGAAVKRCPVAIIVPTHRVIGQSQAEIDHALLSLEQHFS